ncbi:MAG: methyltransferase domain-containing protein [Elusimicrobia bacterium]|nr:methyltransferase domain-containing protein [Elusimicrobiota bacterium]
MNQPTPIKRLRLMVKAGMKDFKRTASFFPSSPAVVRDMVEPLRLGRAKLVVEFGVGTGVVTQALLERMPSSARLLAFELNASLAEFARSQFKDPRVEVVCGGAEGLLPALAARGLSDVDAVASSLGLTLMPDRTRHDILRAVVARLRPKGVFTQLVYMHGTAVPFKRFEGAISTFPAEEFLEDYFRDIDRRWVFRNAPPAFVYACTGPIR